MMVKVDHTVDLTGIDALTQCSESIEDGTVARVVLPSAPKVKIFVRVYNDDSHPGTLDVSEALWRRMRAAAKAEPEEVTLRPLTRGETLSRKLTAKYAAAVLALLAGSFAAVIGLAPLIAPANNNNITAAQVGLVATVEWQSGRVLSEFDMDGLRRARESANRIAPAPDQMAKQIKVVGGILLFLSAIAAAVVAVKAADDG